MLQASFSAKSALIAQQERLNVISNNLANLQTPGFCASRMSFKDTLYTTIKRTDGQQGGVNLQLGSGVIASGTALSMERGAPVQSGQPLDFCITGNGFFTLQGTNGERLYTRDGTFVLSASGQERHLVNGSGLYVLDASGSRITIPEGDASTLSCGADGELMMGTTSVAKLGIATFKNPMALKQEGGNAFSATEASGQAAEAAEPNVRQGWYESANVDLTLEMTRLIQAQRAFSFASQALTTADQMDGMANNLRP